MLYRSSTATPGSAAPRGHRSPDAILRHDADRWRTSFIVAAAVIGVALAAFAVAPGVIAADRQLWAGASAACFLLSALSASSPREPSVTHVAVAEVASLAIVVGLTATLQHGDGVPFFATVPVMAGAYVLGATTGRVLWACAMVAIGLALAVRPGGVDVLLLVEVIGLSGIAGLIVRYLRTGRDALIVELERVATTDSLTGLANRSTFEQVASRLLLRARTSGDRVAVVLLDIDHFRSLNERLGPAAGDAALVDIATLIDQCSRPGDLVARLGGEEFAVVMPGADLVGGTRYAERLGTAVRSRVDAGARLTVSSGVAEYDPSQELDEVMERVHQALYRAKAKGRDQIAVWEPAEAVEHV